MPERPLSPHLSVYKLSKYTLATSILNRIAGLAVSAGLIALAWWLIAAASGASAYARASEVLGSGAFKVLYALLLIAFSYHLVAGLRHLVWDTGRYMERSQSRRSAGLVVGFGIALAIFFIYLAFFCGARAS